jgi:hypothetical protein
MPTTSNSTQTTITDLLDALQKNLPSLSPGNNYILQELVGNAFWDLISTGRRKSLGHEFKALVDSGDQLVEGRGRRSDNCQVYQLK